MMETYFVWVDRNFIGRFQASNHQAIFRTIGNPVSRVSIVPEGELEAEEWIKVSSLLQA